MPSGDLPNDDNIWQTTKPKQRYQQVISFNGSLLLVVSIYHRQERLLYLRERAQDRLSRETKDQRPNIVDF